MENAVKDLEAAWADHEEAAKEEAEVVEQEPEQEPEPEAEQEPEAEPETEEPETEEPETEEPEAKAEEEPPAEEPPAEEPVEAAPHSWSATAREQWKDIPKEARDYIQQREKEMAVGMQKNAQGAQRAEAMDKALAPYSQYFAMTGNQPGKTINDLLVVASNLAMGSDIQKAQVVTQLISQFGVNVETLDTVLAGEQPSAEQQGQQNMQQLIQQELAPVRDFMSQQTNQQRQSTQEDHQRISQEIESFSTNPANEFYKDVELLMADVLDMAGNRGEDLSLQQAYDRACQIDPEVSKIIRQREEAAALQKKKRASSSLPAGSVAPTPPQEPNSVHDALEAAWAAHT